MPKVLFSPENAKEMQKRAIEARKRNRDTLIAKATKAQELQNATQLPAKPDTYTDKMLRRVRKEIDRIVERLGTEDDPNKLDRIASAWSKLAEIERQYADRPLPGTKKPAEAAKARPQRRVFDEPMPDDPEPLVVEVPQ